MGKRFSTLKVMLVALFLMPLALSAQSLTVHNGTGTNSFIPIYGSYVDMGIHSQFIYPASELQAMVGKEITQLTFYSSRTVAFNFTSTFNVQMGEPTFSTFSTAAYDNTTTMTPVYSGTLTVGADGIMTIELDGYTYNGGNLMIAVDQVGTCTYSSVYFYGETTTGAALSSYGSNSPTQRNFLPKTTFDYETPSGCAKVSSVNLDDATITTTGITLTWAAGGSETAWHVAYSTNGGTTYDTVDVATPSYTFNTLNPSTQYTLEGFIYADCGNEWSGPRKFMKTFATACETPATPKFLTMFNNGDAFPPVCWSMGKISGTTTPPFQLISSTYAHSDGYCAQLKDQNDGNVSYLSTGVLPIDSANKYEVVLWVYRNYSYSDATYNDEGIQIWATPNATDTVGGTMLGYVHRLRTQSPVEDADGTYKYNFPITVAGDMHIMIVGISKFGNATYFDDLQVRKIPTCADIAGVQKCVSTSSNSATIAVVDSTVTAFDIAYGVQGTAADDCQVANATGMSHTITGLTDDTYYDIYVRRNCSASDQGEWSTPITIHTKCLPTTTYPLFDDFEDQTANGRLEGCYSTLTDNTGTYALNANLVSASYAQYQHTENGTKFVAVGSSPTTGYNGSSTTSKYVGFRQFQCDPTKYYEVSFYAIKNYSSYSPDSYSYNASVVWSAAGTAEEIDSFTIAHTEAVTVPQQWYKVVAYIQVPTAGVYNFGFMGSDLDGATYYLLFDDFSVREMSTIPPTSVNAENVTNNAADITFESTYTQWQLVVDTVKENIYAGRVYNNTNVTASPVHLTGLEDYMTYYYAMRTINGTDTSLWSDTYSFTTLCDPVASFPFVEDFETMASNELIGGCYNWDGSDTYRLFNYMSASASHLGSNLLSLCSSSSTTYNTSGSGNYGIYRQFELDASKHYQISFYGKKYSSSYTNYGYNVTVVCDTVFGLGNMQEFSSIDVEDDTYTQYKGYFEVAANGTYYVGLQMHSIYGSYYIYIDDITIEEVACIPPSAHAAENITTNSADITFTSSASSWEIIVDDEPIDEFTSTADVVYYNDDVQASPVALTGLDEDTYYYYALRTVAGFDLSDWVYGEFKTKCQPTELPFFEDFEDFEVGTELSGCYYIISEGAGTLGLDEAPYQHSADGELGLASFPKGSTYSGLVYDPVGFYREFAVEAGKTYEISFWAKADYASYNDYSYNVKYIAGTTVDSYVDSVDVAGNTWVKNRGYFTATADTVYNIGLYATLNGTSTRVVFDEFGVKPVTCMPPLNAEITAVTPTTISFDMHATAAQYEIAIDTFEIDLDYDVEPSVIDTVVDTAVVTIPGLIDGKNYYVTVRAICGEDDMSDWINVMTFSTPCFPDVAPFFDDFEDTPEDILGGCYIVDQCGNTYGMAVIDKTTGSATKSNFVKDGNHGLTVGGYPSYGTQVIGAQYMYGDEALYRYMHLEAGKTYQFSIDATTISGRDYIIELGYGVKADFRSMTVLTSEPSPANLTWANYAAYISPEETGDYFVCLHITNENPSSNFQVGFDNYSIKEVVYNEYHDTICGGEDYLLNGFNVAASEIVEGENMFEMVALDDVAGMDTVAVAYVFAYPTPVDADVYDVACEGHEYTGYGIQGVTITADTVFEVITPNVNGCDSLTRVHVTFQPTLYTKDTMTICSNEEFAGQTFEPGVYDTTFVFAAVTTCDSVVELHLTVNEAFEYSETMTDVEAEFTWHEQTIAEDGEYTAAYTTAEGCDSIYHLSVTFKTGVENVGSIEVSIVPNPVKAGASAMVYGDFENVERVEVMNNLGQIIDAFVPKTFPVEVEGIDAAGLYYVRVVTTDGTYVEKLIVE